MKSVLVFLSPPTTHLYWSHLSAKLIFASMNDNKNEAICDRTSRPTSNVSLGKDLNRQPLICILYIYMANITYKWYISTFKFFILYHLTEK